MAIFLPPYTKNHILVFGSITLLLSLFLLIYFSSTTRQPSRTTKMTVVSAASVKEDFKEPLAKAQNGDFDIAWVNDKFLILDVRPREDYEKSHIEGALSAPVKQLQYAALAKDIQLVVFSTSTQDLSQALPIIEAMGLQQVYTLTDTLDNLAKDGYKISTQDK